MGGLGFELEAPPDDGMTISRRSVVRYVISYDVSNDRGRAKIAKILVGLLTRVQYSVFEGEATDDQVARAIERVLTHIDPETDSVRVYRLCGSCERQVTQYGRQVDLGDDDVVVI